MTAYLKISDQINILIADYFHPKERSYQGKVYDRHMNNNNT